MSNITYDLTKKLKIICHKCGQKLDVTGIQPFSTLPCPNCQTALTVPAWFDTYLLEELVGVGGMASVFRALDVTLDREVAIKILNKDIVGAGNNIDLFLHEARTAAIINHQNVIPIFTCGVFQSQPYLVMQYMNSGSLQDVMDQHGPLLPLPNVIQWMRDAAIGLETALRYGVTHHDIKPANIMLDAEQCAKIGDFGISSSINTQRNSMLAEQLKTWVTPDYVSPEKVLYDAEDHRGDIFSLGATFFYLLSGRNPYFGNTIHELVHDRTLHPPPFVHEIRGDIPVGISQLIMAMMHLNPAKRPAYPQIVETLTPYLQPKQQSASNGKKKILSTKKPQGQKVRPSRTTAQSKKPGQRNVKQQGMSSSVLISLILGGVVLLLVVVFLVIAFTQEKKPTGPTVLKNPLKSSAPAPTRQSSPFGYKAP